MRGEVRDYVFCFCLLHCQLNNAGHWDSFLERPFNRVPQLGTQPDFLFINACKQDVLEAEPTNIGG